MSFPMQTLIRGIQLYFRVVLTILLIVYVGCIHGSHNAYGMQPAEMTTKERERNTDFLCGPRCVRFLLDFYGHSPDVDLLQLVREMQWPAMENGSSLVDIKAKLEDNGVYTQSAFIDDPASINEFSWRYPVVVHMKGDEGIGSLGHFSVLLPSSDKTTARVWCGLSGIQTCSWRHLAQKLSGYVLLTAPQSIDSILVNRLGPLSYARQTLSIGIIVACLLAIVVFVHRKTWRLHSQGGAISKLFNPE